MQAIQKKLSANDLGDTGSHMAGILIPKQASILAFFPPLDRQTKNPRMELVMRERRDGSRWLFNYIYYNGKFFGGTRNEYRLTRMSAYLRSINAKVGDEMVFEKDQELSYLIDLVRSTAVASTLRSESVLVLSGGWKIVNI